jgi:hypothetical protein
MEIERFKSVKDVASFIGISPGIHESETRLSAIRFNKFLNFIKITNFSLKVIKL